MSLKHRLRTLLAIRLHWRLAKQVRNLVEDGGVIITSNCIGGLLYENANLGKAMPTVGLFFSDSAFATFLSDFANGNHAHWRQIEPTQLRRSEDNECYEMPLPGGGAVVFLHYQTAEEATEKWNRRYPRMIGRTPFVIASLRDGLTEAMLDPLRDRFEMLMIVGPDGAPRADDLFFDRPFLRKLSVNLNDAFLTKRRKDGQANPNRYLNFL